jgi:uncharacterized protein (TIGR00369 family)
VAEPVELLELWRSMSGLELIRAIADGRVPPAPHAKLAGFTVAEAGSGQVELAWRPGAAVTNPQGNVHGGFIAMALDDACCLASATLNDPFVPMLTLSLHIDYLRPVKADRSYAVTGSVLHPGKRRVVARATVADADGRLIAQASGAVTPNQAFT